MFDEKLINEVANLLYRRQDSIAVAESVTAGYLQAAIASGENASLYFQGGITAYNAKQKYTHLQVNILHTLPCNSVSLRVAEEMAAGVSRSFLADWGLGITGYSSALPGHESLELFACYAIVFQNKTVRWGSIPGDSKTGSTNVQIHFVNTVLKDLHSALAILCRQQL